LDQIEIFFSVLQRKVLTPNDLTDLDALAERILAFQDRYNATATPFDWTFTRTDLTRLLQRTAAHEPAPATAHAA
jgi:phage FluMu protein gp41